MTEDPPDRAPISAVACQSQRGCASHRPVLIVLLVMAASWSTALLLRSTVELPMPRLFEPDDPVSREAARSRGPQ